MEPVQDLQFDSLFEWAFSEVPNRAVLDAQIEALAGAIPPQLTGVEESED